MLPDDFHLKYRINGGAYLQIRKQGTSLQLIRYYASKSDGQKQSVITTVSPDTSPDNIPTSVINKLTPPELQQLKKFLVRTSVERLISRISEIPGILQEATAVISQQSADDDLLKKLQDEMQTITGLLETVSMGLEK
jgi:hypothetical protein